MALPSPEEQLALEWINRFRTDPGGEAERLLVLGPDVDRAVTFFGVDTQAFKTALAAFDPVAPLAWSSVLEDSARTHSDRIIRFDEQAHNFPDEPRLREKTDAVGYPSTGPIAENIGAFVENVPYGHAGFVIDWGFDAEDWIDNGDGTRTRKPDWATLSDGMQDPAGHRNAIMSEAYREIGIGIVEDSDPETDVGPQIVTQHLGSRGNYEAQLLGVVIVDADRDDFYDIGEGLAGVTVTATGDAGTFTTTSWNSGGWQLAAPAGSYTITFSGPGVAEPVTKSATLAGENVKIDAVIQPTNTAPTAIQVSNASVLETAAASTVIGLLTASDPNAGDTHRFELLEDAGGRFAINGSDLIVAGALDHEANASHQVTIRATDQGELSVEQEVTIAIGDVREFADRAQTPVGQAPSDLSAIRDFDGNDLGTGSGWKLIGAADVQFDGDAEFIYINQSIERWATVGPTASGAIDFADHGQGGETRVVGIYIDPLVQSGQVQQGSDFDSQRRFQNDLAIDNLTVRDAFDFDGDGFQEIYFKVNDGTAYLRALMHADGNIQYANYQSAQQVEDYLTGAGFGQDVLDAILL